LNIAVVGDCEPAARLLEQSRLVESIAIRDGQMRVTLAENVTDYSDLPTLLIDAGFKLTLFREEELNLETAFMALTKGITA
jgi:ABC-2 type transport system ATP-binding protein